ncbi:MAG TPA: type II secretion system F family protein [bacterium]|nr:type II secretion system F family protein [Candidatus Omnitrophota bacterium]HOJ62219.1 type II secretion system F family protein [bacterium]HOL95294.1 type II secretion system F family protein [bacterium]HPP02783.1 type II secretion system F family protein [bacterium]HXK95544.1 type II secretion system F family protein [bacterium]
MNVWIDVFSFVSAFLLIVSLAVISGAVKHPVDKRIQEMKPNKRRRENPTFITTPKKSNLVAALGKQVAPTEVERRSMSKKWLAKAGYYSDTAFYTYWGIKILLTALLPSLILLVYLGRQMPPMEGLYSIVCAALLGFLLPDVFLFFVKQKRQENIFLGLPDMLDLLVVCVEAGLGLDAALQKVSGEIHIGSKELSQELQMTAASIRLGQSREAALHDLGERTGVVDLKSFVAVLIQADRFGTSLAQALRVHAEDMRTRRRQRAEELAAKTTVKLIFPLVLFIFPAIFVVIAGPAIIRIYDFFVKQGS